MKHAHLSKLEKLIQLTFISNFVKKKAAFKSLQFNWIIITNEKNIFMLQLPLRNFP